MKTIFKLIGTIGVFCGCILLSSCSMESEKKEPLVKTKNTTPKKKTSRKEKAVCSGKTIELSLKDVKSDFSKFPARVGVPFPEGALNSPENICLWNSDKSERLPVEVKLVSSWKDGSVRWLQLRFQCDVFKSNKNKDKVFLEYGENVKCLTPSTGISCYQGEDDLTVSSGTLKAQFLKNGHPLIDKLYYDINRDGKFQESEQILGPDGIKHNLKMFFKKQSKLERLETAVKDLEVEEKGKIQTTIKISGDYLYQGKVAASFIIRCYFYSGKGFFRFDHVFTYKSDPENDFVADLNIKFNLKPEFINRARMEGKEFEGVDVAVLQDWWNRFRISGKGNKILKKGDKFGGCAEVLSRPEKDLRISFFVKNFWQKYPKGINISKDSVEIGLWPGSLKRLLDMRRYSDTIYLEAPDLETGLTRMSRSAQGTALYHKLFVDFSNMAIPMKNLDGLAALLFDPPVICFSPEWLRKTDVFGNFCDKMPENWPRLWEKMKLFSRWHKANQEKFGWYGMLDFGDWRSRFYFDHWAIWGRHGWANNSADPIYGLMFAYLIGGDVPSFRMAGEAGEHYMNVDVCHYADNTGRLFKNPPELVGSASRHGRQHWSGYLGYTAYTYPVGMCQHYLFTGEERYRDVLYEMGNFLADCGGTHGVFPDMQWISEAFMHEEKYRDFVKKLNAQIKKSRNIICSAPKKIDGAHPEGWPTRMNFNFRVDTDDMPGLLFYLRRNNDTEMTTLFPKMADTFLENYKKQKNKGILSYNPGFHFLLPYAAYLSTKDRKYLDAFYEYYSNYLPKFDFVLNDDMSFEELRDIEKNKIGTTCKTYQDIWYLRSMPYIVAELSALGYDEKSYLSYAENRKGAK